MLVFQAATWTLSVNCLESCKWISWDCLGRVSLQMVYRWLSAVQNVLVVPTVCVCVCVRRCVCNHSVTAQPCFVLAFCPRCLICSNYPQIRFSLRWLSRGLCTDPNCSFVHFLKTVTRVHLFFSVHIFLLGGKSESRVAYFFFFFSEARRDALTISTDPSLNNECLVNVSVCFSANVQAQSWFLCLCVNMCWLLI